MANPLTTNFLPLASNRYSWNNSFRKNSSSPLELYRSLNRDRKAQTSAKKSERKKGVNKREPRESAEEEDLLITDDAEQYTPTTPSRSLVLTSCTITSTLIAALGLAVREASHIASSNGLPIPDCTDKVSFGFNTPEAELVAGSVILITTCRFLLLKIWPAFADSSETANRQVLSPLQPLDYIIVSFLPGISEEILFRGALQPLLGMNWASVLFVAALFGVLHLGGGRKIPFAIWSSFVGALYGATALHSSSLIVPMASHALNNLAGGLGWRFNSAK